MIAAATVVLTLSTALNYCHLFRPVDNFLQTRGLILGAFKRYYFDPRANPTLAVRTDSVLAYVFGYIVPCTIIVWSLLLISRRSRSSRTFRSRKPPQSGSPST